MDLTTRVNRNVTIFKLADMLQVPCDEIMNIFFLLMKHIKEGRCNLKRMMMLPSNSKDKYQLPLVLDCDKM